MNATAPAAWLRYSMQLWQTAVSSQTTIALRLWSFAEPAMWQTAWGQSELLRMVAEKQQAFVASTLAMQRAAVTKRGQHDAAHLLSRALTPYRTRSGANARRLARRR